MKFNSEKKTWKFSSKITKTMWGRKKSRQKWPLIRFPKKNVLSRYFICLYSNDRHNYGSGMPNILNWDFAKRWDHLFLYKPRTLRHPTFLCLDSIPTLRRTLKKASVTGKIELNPHEIIRPPPPPPAPSLCREELIYLHIYIKSNYVVIRSFWCRDNFFWSHQLPFTSASTTNHQWQRESSAHSGWKVSPSGTLNGRSFVFRPQASFNVLPPPPERMEKHSNPNVTQGDALN